MLLLECNVYIYQNTEIMFERWGENCMHFNPSSDFCWNTHASIKLMYVIDLIYPGIQVYITEPLRSTLKLGLTFNYLNLINKYKVL
jgi:hypothetical protein